MRSSNKHTHTHEDYNIKPIKQKMVTLQKDKAIPVTGSEGP